MEFNWLVRRFFGTRCYKKTKIIKFKVGYLLKHLLYLQSKHYRYEFKKALYYNWNTCIIMQL